MYQVIIKIKSLLQVNTEIITPTTSAALRRSYVVQEVLFWKEDIQKHFKLKKYSLY